MDDSGILIPNDSTMKEARELWVKKYGVTSKEFRFNIAEHGKCLTFARDIGPPMPGMECAPLLPVNTTCTISDNLNSVYNTLATDKVNNAEAYEALTIRCNSSVAVKLRLLGPREIDLV